MRQFLQHALVLTRVLRILIFLFVCCSLGTEGRAGAGGGWTLPPQGRMNYEPIRESSGLVASRRFNDVFWTHNDANNPPHLFAVGEHGKLIREYVVPGAANIDWEDIAWDKQGNLYIFDNASLRDAQKRNFLYIFPEPDPYRDEAIAASRKTAIRFPDGAFDCEAILLWEGTLYMVTKPWDGSLPRIYQYSKLDRDGTATFVGTVPVHTMVTGADISDDGRRIALCSYVAIMVFEEGASPAKMLQSRPLIGKLNAREIEGITWHGEELHLSNEEREIFKISKAKWKDKKAPFVKTPKAEVPYVEAPPAVELPLNDWPKGKWLKLHLYGQEADTQARVVWSRQGVHVGLTLPGALPLSWLHQRSPRDYGEWFQAGSVYLLVNTDGARPVSYGKYDRCIVLGRGSHDEVVAESSYLRPATFVALSERPDWVNVEHKDRNLLVTLSRGMPGLDALLDGREIGFNIIVISEDHELTSWAPLTLRYSWDAPSVWGLLELEE